IDIHGYGRSDTTSADWSDAEHAILDIDAAVDYIARRRGVEAVDLLGWSWGTQTTGLYTMRHPEKVAKLILYAPAWKGPPGERRGAPPNEQYRPATEDAARGDFVAGQYEPDVLEKYVAVAMKEDRRAPNGTRLDYLHLP